MKKIIFVLLLAVLSVQVYSQQGDLTIGAKGGFINSSSDINFKNFLYGVDIAYHLSYPLEIAFTGLMNSNISNKNSEDGDRKLAVYSANLDFRLYLLHQREWATGPALGGQYYVVDNKTANLGADKALGFNIGWHARFSLTDNLKVNGGWRYTNAKAKDSKSLYDSKFDISHHLFYLGIAYTFELK